MSPGPSVGARRGRLLSAAALSGAAVMVVELTATRALAPAFGASLYTWTNVIGVVLLALALGYHLGGRLADRRPHPPVLGRVLLVAAVLAVPAPFLAVPFGVWLLPDPEALVPLTATGHVVRGSLAATLLLFAAPVFLMGMVGPFVTRCLEDTGLQAGGAAGRTLAVSTLGSLVGTYLPAHLLIPALGTKATLLSAVVLLLAASMLLLTGRARAAPAGLLCAVGVLAGLSAALPVRGALDPPPDGGAEELRVLREEESPYQYVRVSEWKVPGPDGALLLQTRLSLDEGVLEFQSLAQERVLEDGRRVPTPTLGGTYYDYFALLPELVAESARRPADVLVVGAGAGTMARMLRDLQGGRTGRIVNVEIDASVMALGPALGWQAGEGDVDLVGDGRVLLRALDRAHDVVILDAYARQVTIPFHLATVEFFRLVERRLTRRGVLAINLSVHDLGAPLFRALHRTLAEVFPSVEAVGVRSSWNVMLLAFRGGGRRRLDGAGGPLQETRRAFRRHRLRLEEPPPGALLLTDDHAPTEQLARRR